MERRLQAKDGAPRARAGERAPSHVPFLHAGRQTRMYAARADNTTLNEQFRLWLEQYARRQRAQRAMRVIAELQGKINTGGRKFTREEMNERR